MIRVRIAPSPTGFAHVGTGYVALFNFAFARKNGGKFILRIEDTDQKREVTGGIEVIKEGLSWMGLAWDEFYRQSERLSIYQKYAKKLLHEGKAYEEDGGVVLKVEREDISWNDLIRGEISFPAEEARDFAIIKKDGFPTYNFAVVVDDWETEISHVIRAEDHISNTPRQIAAYKALRASIPEFAHLPLLRNPDKSKISKRKNPVALSWYKEQGFLPEALINFLCLLGWSHPGEKEIFDLNEFIDKFNLEKVHKAGPVFDMNKLLWMNQQHIQQLPIKNLKLKIAEFYDGKYEEGLVEQVVPLINTRIKTLKEFESIAGFFFSEPDVDENLFSENYKSHLESALVLKDLDVWTKEKIDEALMAEVTENKFHTGKFFMDMRIAITGNKVTPPMSESLVILGKGVTIKRLQKASRLVS